MKLFWTIVMGCVSIFLISTAVKQYILGSNSLEDYGISTAAEVVDEIIEEDEIGVERPKKYQKSIPILEYEVNGEMVRDTAKYWASSIDPGVHSSNKLYQVGDRINLYVDPNDYHYYIVQGESDIGTSVVGFLIWGGFGIFLGWRTYKRIRK